MELGNERFNLRNMRNVVNGSVDLGYDESRSFSGSALGRVGSMLNHFVSLFANL